MKLMALSKEFFQCGWNIFDLIIVSASLLDLIFELVDGLSVLRGLRLVKQTNQRLPSTTLKPPKKNPLVAFTVTSFEAGPVVDHDEGAPEHHHQLHRRSGQPHLRPGHCDLHLCRDRDAVVCQRLHSGEVLSGSGSSMELHGLLPLVHDDLPDSLRGVDRASLGLHASRKH